MWPDLLNLPNLNNQTMSNRDKYRIYAKDCHSIPLFLLPWWMDAVCGEKNWDVCLSFDNGEKLRGVLVFFLRKKYGIHYISQPTHTPYTGLWLDYVPGMTPYRRNRFEKKNITTLLFQLPKLAWFEQRFHYQLYNWLPFYWNGFKQNTHYTNLIDIRLPKENLYQNIRYNIRWSIRRAKNENIRIINGPSLFQKFFNIYSISARENNIHYLTYTQLEHIHQAIQEENAGNIFLAIDENDNVHAGAYILWDRISAYYWLGASDLRYRKSGAVSLLLWEAIQSCADKVPCFDFDGSMNEGTEQFFSSFGTIQTPCFAITKSSNCFWDILLFIKNRWH